MGVKKKPASVYIRIGRDRDGQMPDVRNNGSKVLTLLKTQEFQNGWVKKKVFYPNHVKFLVTVRIELKISIFSFKQNVKINSFPSISG